MATTKDKNLPIIEHELNFIRRHIQRIEGAGREDFETVDEIGMAIESALRALAEHRLDLQPSEEEFPDEIMLPEAA